jgi:hypothetical protein
MSFSAACEAHAGLIVLMPGMNPRHTTRMNFSASFEALPFQNPAYSFACWLVGFSIELAQGL